MYRLCGRAKTSLICLGSPEMQYCTIYQVGGLMITQNRQVKERMVKLLRLYFCQQTPKALYPNFPIMQLKATFC